MPTEIKAPKEKLHDVTSAVSYFKQLGCTRATLWFVRRLIASGQLAHVRIGKPFYVRQSAIDAWILKNERRSR